MAQRQSKKLIDIHSEARIQFDRIQEAIRDIRQQCLNDRRFYSIAGAQWEGDLGEQFENKPKFEINKVHLSMIRIFNEWRANRIDVDFVSKDGKNESNLSDTCDGLYRSDEQDSSAQEAYDNGFEEGAGGGFGAWRLRAEYEDEYDEENEKQRILMEPIYDADTSVYFDLDAKKYDKKDAKFCFVVSSHTRESFIETWGEDPASWPKEMTSTLYFDWATVDVVYVAEYYVVEEVKESIYIYKTLDGAEEKYKDSDFENDETLAQTLESIGTQFDRERKVKTRKVHKYIMSGNKILEDSGYIAGKNIPIIPYYGKRWFIDNIERCQGHVRLAVDVQRLKNMQTSTLAEISALSTVEKPIMLPEQMAGHELRWADDNIKNYPYLLINPIKDINGQKMPSGPLAYTKVPNIPPAMAALLQLTDQDMKEILGSQEAGEKLQANLSGKAVELVQQQLDMQTFIYMSNMAKSLKRTGEVWLSMAQEIYVEEERSMKTIGLQEEVGNIQLMKPFMNKDTGEVELQNDLSKANLDVSVSIGPSSSTKRSSTVRTLLDMMRITTDPETAQVLSSMAIMNMEGEGISDVQDFFRNKMLVMGVIKPTEEEAKEMAEAAENAPPDPNTEYLQAAALEAEANAAKARADTVLTISKSENTQADTGKKEAETIETLAGVSADEQARAIESARALGSLLEEPSVPQLQATQPQIQAQNPGLLPE